MSRMNDHSHSFGRRLTLVRICMGLDQATMAWLLGMSLPALDALERGLMHPTMDEAGKIASRLEVPKDWLLGLGQTFPWGG